MAAFGTRGGFFIRITTDMFKQNLMTWKIGQKKTEFKQERNDRPKSVFEKILKNFPQAMDARKYRIVFYWIYMFGVKQPKNQHFQPENTSNTLDWRVRTNLNGTAQKPWGPPLPRGCNLVIHLPVSQHEELYFYGYYA